MNSPEENKTQAVGRFRPSLTLYHPNAKGTGCALRMSLHPAHDDVSGCIMLTLANQLTAGDARGPNPVFPRFDWENRMTVKLDFDDITRMLQVFRGECESIADGRGLYHSTSAFTTKILLRHSVEPSAGYSLELYRNSRDGKDESRARIFLAPNEALGICCSVESSLGVIAFGIPMLVEHDVSEYRARERNARNATAA